MRYPSYPLLVLLLSAAGCNDSITEPDPAVPHINAPRTQLEVGDTLRLSADMPVTWSSSNSAVILIDANGWARARSAGSAEVSATSSNNTTSKVTLTVTARAAVRVTTNEIPLLIPGDTFRIMAVAFDRLDSIAVGARITYSSADPGIITVDSTGLVRAVSGGATSLIIHVNGVQLLNMSVGVALITPAAGKRVIVAGAQTTACAIAVDRNVHCWGLYDWLTPRATGMPQAKSISLGPYEMCVLQTAGGVACSSYFNPQGNTQPTSLRFTSLSSHTTKCGVEVSGKVYCWGDGYWGQLGDGRHGETGADGGYSSATPLLVEIPDSMVDVAVGEMHVCALAASGRVYCWGNQGPWLGRGESRAIGATPVPHRARPINGTGKYARIASGVDRSCALTILGQAMCWGAHSSTIQIESGTAALVEISVSASHACGLTRTGDAHCWGSWWRNGTWSDAEQFGLLQTSGIRFAAVAAGTSQSCGIATTGEAYCWGSRAGGGLGDGSSFEYREPTLVAGGLTFAHVASTGSSTCGITTSSKTYCWGANRSGELGDGTNTDRIVPTPVAGSAVFRDIAGDGSPFEGRYCALDTDGKPYCWGHHDYATKYNVPTPVPTTLVFTQIATSHVNTCALTADGTAYCWGSDNNHGQLGSGDRTTSATPRPVVGTIKFRSITPLRAAMCGVTLENDVACWGNGGPGFYGTAAPPDRCTASAFYSEPCSLIPFRIPNTANTAQVGGSESVPCLLDVYGVVKCWGTFYNGTVNCSRSGKYPGTCVYVPEAASGSTALIRTLFEGTAIDGNGRLYTINTPLRYPGLTGPFVLSPVPGNLAFSASGGQTCALALDGAAYCWGSNDRGQIGNGQVPFERTPVRVAGSLLFVRE